MPIVQLENGLVVRVRAFRRHGRHVVIADAVRGENTRAYDREYYASIARFERAWVAGMRGNELVSPLTGAEALMMRLRCDSGGTGARHSSRMIGGSGTEWRVRWNIDDPLAPRYRVGDSVANSVTVRAVAFQHRGRNQWAARARCR